MHSTPESERLSRLRSKKLQLHLGLHFSRSQPSVSADAHSRVRTPERDGSGRSGNCVNTLRRQFVAATACYIFF